MQFSFRSELANTLFDTPPNPDRDAYEVALVDRFRAAVEGASSKEIFRSAHRIDSYLLPKLSGRNLLAVAKIIEMKAPAALDTMPRLRAHRAHAARAAELAQILSPNALERVISALRQGESTR